jgi:hypothetical protein
MAEFTAARRATLETISAATFANPFSRRRHQLDLALTGAGDSVGRDELLQRVIAKVDGELDALRSVELDGLAEADRALVEHAKLFSIFHHASDAIDEHVEAQLQAGEDPIEFAPGGTLMSRLKSEGFSDAYSRRLVAVLFQMRRAFYFVDRGLTGVAPCMRTLRERLWSNVFTRDLQRYESHLWDKMEDFSTIILGETGTGKGLAAAAIGRSGFIPYDANRRRFAESFTGAFVPINLSQFPATLIESELFGHRRGAFTGAMDNYEGAFARCSRHGSVFLDEIGEVSIPIQIKLLQVLQERGYSPVGSHDVERFSGRVIAATHRPLDELRRTGQFRDDFFYRLCSDVVDVPPLRQRIAEDGRELRFLLEVVIEKIAGEPHPDWAEEIHQVIGRHLGDDYAWPGNVRELEQCARRVILGYAYAGDRAQLGDTTASVRRALDHGGLTARELLDVYCKSLYERFGTYEAVARRTGLDRRTVKKHVEAAS